MAPHFAFVPTSLSAAIASFPRTHTSSQTSLTALPIAPSVSHRPLASPTRRSSLSSPPPSAPSPAKAPSRILLWFHTDLRVHDNLALLAATRATSVPSACLVPVAAGASLDSPAAPLLAELKASLTDLGSGLLTLPGPTAHALISVCKKLNLDAVYFNRSVFPAHVAAEKAVTDKLREAGIHVEAFWGNVLQQPQSSLPATEGEHDGVTALATRLTAGVAMPEDAPHRLPALPAAARSLRGQRVVSAKSGGGSSAGVKVMEGMQKGRETLLVEKSPDLAVLLKVFLDYGAVSPKMVAQKVVQVMGACRGRTFSELVWREYVCFAAHRAAGVATGAAAVAV